jgi:D-tyrosyl-tRNA(Tyr) deacylase
MDRVIGAIDRGLLVFVAVVPEDDDGDVTYVAERLRCLRVFSDPEGRMNLSVEDVGGALLLVSQFTLAADTRRGRRPSFSGAAAPQEARRRLRELVNELEKRGVEVQTGKFGASMRVQSINDGPVTLIVDSSRATRGAGNGP